jgi:uncharacterized protein (DUF302 family)
MTPDTSAVPAGTQQIDGIVSRRSPVPVADTVARLTDAIQYAGAKVFAVIDQSAEAARVGQSLRDTTMVIFGSPQGGTPVMAAAPLAALDLPLKILVWTDDDGETWMTYLTAAWLASRYDLPPELAKPLSAVDALTGRVASSA